MVVAHSPDGSDFLPALESNTTMPADEVIEPIFSPTDAEAAAVHEAVLASKERRKLRLKKQANKVKPKPPLEIATILKWIEAYRYRTGRWPTNRSGPITEAEFPNEDWRAINYALSVGSRGCPGGSSLSMLIAEHWLGRTGPRVRENWTEERILQLADAYFKEHGSWPNRKSGNIAGSPQSADTWLGINEALIQGNRGLAGGSSLARLLFKHRGVPNKANLASLMQETILEWADAHHARTGKWPNHLSGEISESPGETWAKLDGSLRKGQRGVGRKFSLAQLLHKERGVRIKGQAPALTVEQIQEWACQHYEIMGNWPTITSGKVLANLSESWDQINSALTLGLRGLPGGSSIAKQVALLGGKRKTDTGSVPADMQYVCMKIDDYREEHGAWPTRESLVTVDAADTRLRCGKAVGTMSFATLIADELGPRTRMSQPSLTTEMILQWADAHKKVTGEWPTAGSGMILHSPNEDWGLLSRSMRRGMRGLNEAISLSKLLERERAVPHRFRCELTEELVLTWADAYKEEKGVYPGGKSLEPIPQSPGDKWRHIDHALREGHRGLPGGSSLAMLFAEHRGKRKRMNAPPLTVEQIEQWVRLHFERTRTYPTYRLGGIVEDAPEETWREINGALANGQRGLEGCGYRSLCELIKRRITESDIS